MSSSSIVLPSWRTGPTRDSVVQFLAAAESLPPEQRVAAFDNDGTLWCERPTAIQYDFFEDALATAVQSDPTLGDRPEFAAVLAGDLTQIAALGLPRVAMALAGLFEGMQPDEFNQRARQFMAGARHRTLDLPLRATVYTPMLELIDELRRRQFSVFIVSGGGTEFVRAVSDDLYGIAPEAVVGTLIDYEFSRDANGHPFLRRAATISHGANEGAAKVTNIQTQLGRRPILGVGNSAGDREMLEWACAGPGPGLALLVDHDDERREFSYVSTAGTFEDTEPLATLANRLGWTTVSMANDWSTVFDPALLVE